MHWTLAMLLVGLIAVGTVVAVVGGVVFLIVKLGMEIGKSAQGAGRLAVPREVLPLLGARSRRVGALGKVVGLLGSVGAGPGEPVYFGNPYLFTRTEAAFYRVLVMAVGEEYVVMGKVRLADAVDVRARGRAWGNAFNRICRKHVDFVLLDAKELRLRLVVELDDVSHGRADRVERDGFVDGVLREGGVGILRVREERE